MAQHPRSAGVAAALEDRLHGVYTAGADRLEQEIRDVRDRFVASDPGWGRLRQGVRALIAVGTTLLVEWGLATWLHQPAVLGLLLGAVVAMLTSTGIREVRRAVIARTAGLAPVVAAVGATLGIVTAEQHLLGLAAFVAVSFVAVWVRRFGPRWFTLGFLFWQGFFFALFLHPPVSLLPFLLLAIAVSGVWVGFLLLTLLYDDPQHKLRRIVTAFRARARAGIAACADVVQAEADLRSVRQLRRQLVQLAEIALLLDGQLADARALPDGVSPGRLRRWTVDVEIGMDEVAGAAMEIAARRATLPDTTLEAVRETLQTLGWSDHATALAAAGALDRLEDRAADVRRLAAAAMFLLATVQDWDSGLTGPAPDAVAAGSPAQGTDDLLDEEDFEPAVTLIGGNLPGSAALAQQAIEKSRGRRLSFPGMRLTTRQAVQAAVAAGLAILAGEAISPARFYWAVIAAFLAFAGTATSGETLRKAAGRIGGTVVGLVAAVALANVTQGHQWVAVGIILVCIFGAFFLQNLSYGAMIFFITVLLGQLYTLLGTFSDELLELRVAETVAGAAIGVAVSLVVLPTHSRATLRVARQVFLTDLGNLLDACARTLSGAAPERDLLTLTMLLEASGRQLVQTRRALTRGRLFGSDRTGLRHRISVLGTCGAAARTLAVGVTANPPGADRAGAVAAAVQELAAESRRLADAPELGHPPPLAPGAPDVLRRVRSSLDPARPAAEGGDGPHMGRYDDGGAGVVAAVRRLAEALALLGRRSSTAG